MNAEHLRTFLWLRWRLRINQMRKGGIANSDSLAILAGLLASLFSLGLAIGLFFVGYLALAKASPTTILFVGCGIAVPACLFFLDDQALLASVNGLKSLTPTKFQHLPVSRAVAACF